MTAREYRQFETSAVEAARLGGEVLIRWQNRFTASEKHPKDVVTEADLESQSRIFELLSQRFPDHGFIGEEDNLPAHAAKADATYHWIIDPLDGTLNYVHSLPSYGVSVGLCRGKELIAGAIFDPVLKECFSASLGNGARLNDRPIHTSGCEVIGESLVAASFPRNFKQGDESVEQFLNVSAKVRSTRRTGSAAINLCNVAMGRLDGYWATSVHSWDVAAGAIIVREAGGVITDINGKPFDVYRPRFVAAATQTLCDELQQTLYACEIGK